MAPRSFKPLAVYSSITKINVQDLVQQGINTLLIDIDNTLVPRDTKLVPSDVLSWVAEVKQLGIAICLLSNNWHKVVFAYAKQLDVPLVYKAMKPAPFAYLRALGKVGGKRAHACMIGDQVFTDVFGAAIVGMRSLLVEPQSQVDLWYTNILRKFEARIIKNVVRK